MITINVVTLKDGRAHCVLNDRKLSMKHYTFLLYYDNVLLVNSIIYSECVTRFSLHTVL